MPLKTPREAAEDCARYVRGCTTDEQYQDLVQRIEVKLIHANSEIARLEAEIRATAEARAPMPKVLELDLKSKLCGIHSALDDALGDSDVTHMDDEELRDAYPVQWAAQRIAEVIASLKD